MSLKIGDDVFYGTILCQIVGICEEGTIYLKSYQHDYMLSARTTTFKALIRKLTKLDRALK